MKLRSERMKVVFDQAERHEQKAMDALSAARQYLDQQLAQLANLEDYRKQYSATMRDTMKGSMDVRNLQAYQGFVSQVDKAIEHQKLVVDQAQQQFDRYKQEWLAFREKRKGIGDLIERYRFEEEVAREKKEAKRLEDDLVSRRFRT